MTSNRVQKGTRGHHRSRIFAGTLGVENPQSADGSYVLSNGLGMTGSGKGSFSD